jgi:Spx/MgsR family transcriptional regulator
MMAAMKTIQLYGIPNCDTVKKARDWLSAQGVDYTFHDFKKQGVPADALPIWLQAVGRDTLINRKGPTWRNLGPAVHATVVDDASATAVILANSSVIKRPVVVWLDGEVTVGFKPEMFAERPA